MSGAGFLRSMSSPLTHVSKRSGGRSISLRLPTILTWSALVATASFSPRRRHVATNSPAPGMGRRRPTMISR